MTKQTLTNSEIEAFDACPALHGFGYHELLRPKIQAFRLSRGQMGHAGIAAGWRAASTAETLTLGIDDRIEHAVRAASVTVDAASVAAKAELAKTLGSEVTAEMVDRIDESAEICRFCCREYFALRGDEFDVKRFVPLAIEEPFEIRLRSPNGGLTSVSYSGVIDLVLLDIDAQAIRLEDHKFVEKPGAQYERKIPLSTQLTGYVYAIRQALQWLWANRATDALLVKWIEQASVGQVAYNILKAKMPTIPSVNKNGRVSVAQIDTTRSIYADALLEQTQRGFDTTPEQLALLDKLSSAQQWVTKVEDYRSDDEAERWLSETRIKAKQIRETGRNISLRVRRTGHCTGFASSACQYASVCLDPSSQHTRETFYRVATSRHEEVTEVTNGSKEESSPW